MQLKCRIGFRRTGCKGEKAKPLGAAAGPPRLLSQWSGAGCCGCRNSLNRSYGTRGSTSIAVWRARESLGDWSVGELARDGAGGWRADGRGGWEEASEGRGWLLPSPWVTRGAGSRCSTSHPPCFPSSHSSERWESAVALQKLCTKLCAHWNRVGTGGLQLEHQFLADLSCEAPFPCCFWTRFAEPHGAGASHVSLPPSDNLRVTCLAWISLNIPNYQQTLSFPMGTAAMHGPGVSLAFWPACPLPAASSSSFKTAPGALWGAACPWGMPSKPPLVSGCLQHCSICSLTLPNPAWCSRGCPH